MKLKIIIQIVTPYIILFSNNYVNHLNKQMIMSSSSVIHILDLVKYISPLVIGILIPIHIFSSKSNSIYKISKYITILNLLILIGIFVSPYYGFLKYISVPNFRFTNMMLIGIHLYTLFSNLSLENR